MKETLQKMLDLLPEYIETNYPKGDTERGKATVHIVIFIHWMLKQIDEANTPKNATGNGE